MAKDLFYPGSILSLHRKAADKLIASGDGDAALLYLCFLTDKDGAPLRWDPDRLENAHQTLLKLGLADPKKPALTPPPEKIEDDRPPEYTGQDVLEAMREDAAFAAMVRAVEQSLGKTLHSRDIQVLLYLTRYLNFSPEVVLMLVNWCLERTRVRQGPGRKPSLYDIRREGHRWQKAGVDSLESADAYIRRQSRLNTKGREWLTLLDRPDRNPTEREAEYLNAWMEMGFDGAVVREAYERTVFQVGDLKWNYMNGILVSWHNQGLHTIGEVQEAETRRKASVSAAKPKAGGPDDNKPVDMGDLAWILSAAGQKED